ncbi:hypothetical protein ACJIZ3_013088 [Penstemon smallii]|uniref:Uncharacterized protein n=1 Tax=Penstemon smallii TaxID=265156 RepID=A0ABD3UQZ9_9LAMI
MFLMVKLITEEIEREESASREDLYSSDRNLQNTTIVYLRIL